MCKFFSFVTAPYAQPRKAWYFNWKQRQEKVYQESGAHDSHSMICKHFGLNEDTCNKYEYNPLTNKFQVDQINGEDDSLWAKEWVSKLNFKKVVEPLIVKRVVNPLTDRTPVDPTAGDIENLRRWVAVRAPVWNFVGVAVWNVAEDAVGAAVWDAVGDAVWNAVGNAVWNAVGDAVGDAVWAYIASFFNIQYEYDFSPLWNLWERGFVPSFYGKIWRLHHGPDATIAHTLENVTQPGE